MLDAVTPSLAQDESKKDVAAKIAAQWKGLRGQIELFLEKKKLSADDAATMIAFGKIVGNSDDFLKVVDRLENEIRTQGDTSSTRVLGIMIATFGLIVLCIVLVCYAPVPLDHPSLWRSGQGSAGSGRWRFDARDRGQQRGGNRTTAGGAQSDEREPREDRQRSQKRHRLDLDRLQTNRLGQRRFVAAHRGAGLQPGGDGLLDGRAHQHGKAQR